VIDAIDKPGRDRFRLIIMYRSFSAKKASYLVKKRPSSGRDLSKDDVSRNY